jgi:hypothetical protein
MPVRNYLFDCENFKKGFLKEAFFDLALHIRSRE